MHRLGKWMRALALVGQLGFCIITPPLVLVYLANLLVTKHGWGTWITIVAILFGLLELCASRITLGVEKDAVAARRRFNDYIDLISVRP